MSINGHSALPVPETPRPPVGSRPQGSPKVVIDFNDYNAVEVNGEWKEWARRVVTEEVIPCGRGITVEYFDSNGISLRRDFTSLVDARVLQPGADIGHSA